MTTTENPREATTMTTTIETPDTTTETTTPARRILGMAGWALGLTATAAAAGFAVGWVYGWEGAHEWAL